MSSPTSYRPQAAQQRSAGRSSPFTYLLIVLLGVCMLVPATGLSVIADANAASHALEEGVHGTFTAAHTERNGRAGREHWVGTFVSDDNTVVRPGIRLGLNDAAREVDPAPVFSDTYLSEDELVAYPADFDTASRARVGIAIVVGALVIGLTSLVLLIARPWRRARR